MRRFSSSSLPAAVSKRHWLPSLTSGMANGEPSRPMCAMTLPSVRVSKCVRSLALATKRARSSAWATSSPDERIASEAGPRMAASFALSLRRAAATRACIAAGGVLNRVCPAGASPDAPTAWQQTAATATRTSLLRIGIPFPARLVPPAAATATSATPASSSPATTSEPSSPATAAEPSCTATAEAAATAVAATTPAAPAAAATAGLGEATPSGERLRAAAGRATPAGVDRAAPARVAEGAARPVCGPRGWPLGGLRAFGTSRPVRRVRTLRQLRRLTAARPIQALPAAGPVARSSQLAAAGTTRAVEPARGVAVRPAGARRPLTASELLGGGGVAIAHTAPMLRLELPLLPVGLDVRPVHVDVLVHVHVGVGVSVVPATATAVVVVHVDVVIVPVEGRSDERTRGDAGPEADHARGHRAPRCGPEARIVRGRRRHVAGAVDRRRRVGRHVDDLRVRGLHGDGLPLPHDRLLWRALERSRVVRLGAHALRGVHQLGTLAEERVAQILRPLEVLRHAVEHVGEARQRLDARVPVLLLERLFERVSLQRGILLPPAIRLDHLERIRRGDADRRQHLVGIERDRRDHLLELRRRELRVGRRSVTGREHQTEPHEHDHPAHAGWSITRDVARRARPRREC